MEQFGLFQKETISPLAHRMRPSKLSDFVGQRSTLKKIDGIKPQHLILWGPPGTGKTTLANILAKEWGLVLYNFNAVMSGIPELRETIAKIAKNKKDLGETSLLFIDEIHRFNKAQQDALLPHLERGDFIFIGATTESPQTGLNRAILSRVQTLRLWPHDEKDILAILERAQKICPHELPNEALTILAEQARGDARWALNKLESLTENPYDQQLFSEILKEDNRVYDQNEHRHYDVISAFIKSIRGSDPDAAILWLAVMLDGGEDPVFIARRLIIAASEDVGNANPMALQVATSALLAVQNIGMPEARIPLAQATTYLASSPKSNAAYNAINAALDFVKEHPTLEVPTHLRNHHPDIKNYKYAHDYPLHYVDQEYMAIGLGHEVSFYHPTELGSEANLKIWLDKLKGKQ